MCTFTQGNPPIRVGLGGVIYLVGKASSTKRQVRLDKHNAHPELQASHLCHNPHCLNWRHVALEPKQVNESRKFCGPSNCRHVKKCVRNGSQYQYTSC